MEKRGISEDEVRIVFEDPDLKGYANLGRLYSQKTVEHRRIRVIYNQEAEEVVVVTVMIRRRGGAGS